MLRFGACTALPEEVHGQCDPLQTLRQPLPLTLEEEAGASGADAHSSEREAKLPGQEWSKTASSSRQSIDPRAVGPNCVTC